MIRRISGLVCAVLTNLCPLAPCRAEPGEELRAYLERDQFEGRARVSAQEYYILMAQPETADRLFTLLAEPLDHRVRERALHAIRAIGSVDKQSVPFERLGELVDDAERRYDPTDSDSSDFLRKAYWTMAHYATGESLRFLIDRAEATQWRGGPMPVDRTIAYSDGSRSSTSPATLALLALLWDGRPEAVAYRESYLAKTEGIEDPVIAHARSQLIAGRSGALSSVRRIQEAARALKQRGFRLDEAGRFVPLDDSISPASSGDAAAAAPAAEVAEVARDLPRPDPEATEAPAARRWLLPGLGVAVAAIVVLFWRLALRRRTG